MKKNIYAISLLLGLVSVLVLKSCSESTRDEPADPTKNVILFEDTELLGRVSDNPLDNHIYLVELLGSNQEQEEIVQRISDQGIDLSSLNIDGIRKYHMNNTDILMYSVPYLRSENSLIVYRYGDIYQVNIAEFNMKDKGMTEFRLRTLDGNLHYGLTFNSNNEVGEYIRSDNVLMNEFSNSIYELNTNYNGHNDKLLKEVQPTKCCRRMEDWEGCMDCTLSYFSSKWYGTIAFTIIGKEFLAAIAVSCIGSGPSSIC